MIPSAKNLNTLREEHHSSCLACGEDNRLGLSLHWHLEESGDVVAEFESSVLHQSYKGTVHGGIASMLLDAAMVNCLFAHGIAGVTADLHVRLSRPMKTQGLFSVRGRLVADRDPFFKLQAEIKDETDLCARAEGKFVRR